jgi:hypothetical protein
MEATIIMQVTKSAISEEQGRAPRMAGVALSLVAVVRQWESETKKMMKRAQCLAAVRRPGFKEIDEMLYPSVRPMAAPRS